MLPLITFSFALPLQYLSPHGYHPTHISNVHKHGAHMADTSLHLDGCMDVDEDDVATLGADAINDVAAPDVDLVGNDCTACIRLEIDEPANRDLMALIYSCNAG